MIKIILADDQKMFIDGMAAFLEKEKDITIIGEALNGDDVLKILETQSVDVVVLDIEMPEKDGLETTKIIKQEYPETKVLILTMYNEKEFIVKLMELGANGYILKNKTKEELVGAIHNVFRGQPHFGLEILTKATAIIPNSGKNVQLTERETEILCLIAEGLTTKQISSGLYISEPTVNTHRRNLLRKLEFPNDKFLVRYAIKKGLIKP